MKDYQGVIWMCVISLKRVDAACLGYNSDEQWWELIQSKRINFSKYMKIDSRNFRWYCAFHNECHLPQYHLMFYSVCDSDVELWIGKQKVGINHKI